MTDAGAATRQPRQPGQATFDTGQENNGVSRLLGTNRPLRGLFAARCVCGTGDSLSLVALMLHVADTAGQGLAIALLLLAGDFAPSLLGTFTGAISDRFDRRRVMILCEIGQALIMLVIALWLPALPILLALVAARAIIGQVFMPASRAAVPALVADRDLPVANSAIGFGTNAAEVAGPLIAAALVPLVSTRGLLLVDAVTFLLSALFLLRLQPLPARPVNGDGPDGPPGQALPGISCLLANRALLMIFVGFIATVAFNGIDDVALVLFAKETLGTGDWAVGLLLAAVGIGLVVGYALLARAGGQGSMPLLLVGGFFVSSAGNLLTGLAWAVGAAFTVQAVRGLGIAAMDVAANTLLQRLVPASLLGRAFGSFYGAVGVAAATSYLAGGLLLDATSPRTTFLLAGGGGMLTALLVALGLSTTLRDLPTTAAGTGQQRPDGPP
ncbi:Predicted arabinose efflux permease, MFS family [Parafrankia irregularis]|uniref:Predicted arabinose efflux permease, MFS family n=1 Tax=Parafrankia irregularis TaxID=795642 RepID=A0A0S4QTX3_9ACTN|nr:MULTISPECIES: MFS transporter [Parafrankia]MBE3203697.1 MFS transporter [Parafrankia sp. CH37]CUU59061.1 Predicted arabinose efflux permease, MFS family [Parafrankia irregularis]